ncbi:nucleoside triphosphate pyrophosphohydrolase [Anaeromyxobacter oryzae]|uniref:Nucleoside triphosphate pyrophosphohydrolase n=1 Tax=Anaeromyxobacter oryzae TaxID=2918170 RepID=A0ABM7X286_9BACT|nr:nucleoside triphosphate pyrophosphohydrolase [Anaeromyxobacter oryzae]BDG05903.1 nucleoside triphosphate pyrophosphohydrolase [Anaeromyxobacter oryzae]
MSRNADAIERLLGIMERLRGPDGCPWDREQTLRSIRPYVLEETYEVLEAIDSGDAGEHREELGDLLLQIVFQAQLRREEGAFDFADVAEAISSKLVYRHPHVFGDADVKDAEGVLRQWAALKREEKKAKGGGHSVLEGVPREMPALARADRLTEKASRIGFDWPDAGGARAKVTEELAELDEALASGDRDALEHELGDALFALANVGRKLGIPPEEALRGAIARFISRFTHVERELARRGVPHGGASLDEMDAIWDEAKAIERGQGKSSAPTPPERSPQSLGKERG